MDFPTLPLYSSVSKEQMWKNFVDLVPTIKHDKFFVDSYARPKTGFNPMPPKFMGSFVLIDSSAVDYFTVDGITDFYTEEQRMRARKFYRPDSPWRAWKSTGASLSELSREQIKEFRDKIYATHSEATLFRPSWAKGVLTTLADALLDHPKYANLELSAIKVGDISSGWGDRLLAAVALGMQYQGYDPNTNLKPGHDEIIKDFGNPERHIIRYEPFEKNTNMEKCHIIFSSPPFYKLEVYDGPGQSIDEYPEFKDWMNNFLLKSLEIAWEALETGGILAIHMCDYYDKQRSYNMIQPMLNHVITFDQAAWLGVIGLMGERGKIWPVWCWRKD
jgi:hypothetical protein